MKQKKWEILVIFLLISFISSTGLYAQKFRGPGAKFLMEQAREEERYTMDELMEIFYERNLRLSMYFAERNFEELGNYFGPLGWLQTDDGDIVMGSVNIAKYFDSLSRNVRFVVFRSTEINIEFDKHLYDHQSSMPNSDPVYPITEKIKIIFNHPNKSPVIINSYAMYNHSRPTFRNGPQ